MTLLVSRDKVLPRVSVPAMDGNAGQPDPFRPSPHKACTSQAGPPRPAQFVRATVIGPPHPHLVRGPAG